MPKKLLHSITLDVPKEVEIWCKRRQVRVKGPRGTLKRAFRHASVDMRLLGSKAKGQILRVDCWHGNRKQQAVVRTIVSHVRNMITGVTKGFQYHLKSVYAHFPITTEIAHQGKRVRINNFIGERYSRVVDMMHGVTVKRSPDVKDEIIISGNDVELVAQSAANVQQCGRVRNKDVRKFLDGVYVSEKTTIEGGF